MATDAAPERPGRRSPARGEPRKLSEELARLQEMFAARAVPLNDVIAVLQGRAYILLLILLSLPFLTPLPLPGLSTPFGLVIGLVALRLTLGQKPWLPRRLLAMELPAGFFGKVIGFTRKLVALLEKLLRPRWLVVTQTGLARRLHAFIMLISALALLLPLPIPFTNSFPAWTILLVAGGLLERDGVFVLAGHVVFAAGVAYFFFLGHSADAVFDAVKAFFGGAP